MSQVINYLKVSTTTLFTQPNTVTFDRHVCVFFTQDKEHITL